MINLFKTSFVKKTLGLFAFAFALLVPFIGTYAQVSVSNVLTGSNLALVTDIMDSVGTTGASSLYSLVITVVNWLLANLVIVVLLIAVIYFWRKAKRQGSGIM